ncbi:peptidase S10 [Croceicoccus sp. Ery5]|uniref:S10 family serine carboxypeptidase-like protein n=1 Tax=Croceicoccus sp. Ery5 TaxID=1703340 RepID=UPI001E5E88B1|nr:peptidase S10 [Croceicoccus sp. Ery5]
MPMKTLRTILSLLANPAATIMAAAALAAPASAQNPDLPMPPAFLRAMEPMEPRDSDTVRTVETHHSIVIGGRTIPYRAIVTETPVRNDAGEVAVVAVSYGYIAEGGTQDQVRPVLFIFNGGPGASSSPLHMNAFGPRRMVTGDNGSARMADNPHSLIDVADLVFIDPPGTGASMPVKGRDPASLFSVDGDARAVADMVQQWRVANGRENAPFALVGESYGTARALAMLGAQIKGDQPLPDGVALFSLSIGGGDGPVMSDVSLFPTLAATAWYHDAVDRGGMGVDEFFAKALAFAQGEYADALILGAAAEPAQRQRVAKGMERFLGLPAEQFLQSGLKLDRQAFMLGLLADKGLRTGQLDGRVTRPVAESNFHPPFDDPSMSLGTETGNTIARYLGDELGYTLPAPYRSLNLGINFKWNWGDRQTYATREYVPYLVAAREQKPDISLLTVGGYYDITTPVHTGIFALNAAGIGPSQRQSIAYPAGHSAFEDEDVLTRFAQDMRVWASSLKR